MKLHLICFSRRIVFSAGFSEVAATDFADVEQQEQQKSFLVLPLPLLLFYFRSCLLLQRFFLQVQLLLPELRLQRQQEQQYFLQRQNGFKRNRIFLTPKLDEIYPSVGIPRGTCINFF
jgi:hypothetical protein